MRGHGSLESVLHKMQSNAHFYLPPQSSPPTTMSEQQSYESRMADLKLNRFASRWQSSLGHIANPDNSKPQSTDDDDSMISGKTGYTQPSTMSVFKGLRVGQAGMIWGSDGTLLGKIQDDGLADPEELEGSLLNEKGEVLDEDGQKIGQAFVDEAFAGTRFRNAREHSYYKMKPDENGFYHCPYAALELCWHKPQKLKSNFESVIPVDVSTH